MPAPILPIRAINQRIRQLKASRRDGLWQIEVIRQRRAEEAAAILELKARKQVLVDEYNEKQRLARLRSEEFFRLANIKREYVEGP